MSHIYANLHLGKSVILVATVSAFIFQFGWIVSTQRIWNPPLSSVAGVYTLLDISATLRSLRKISFIT